MTCARPHIFISFNTDEREAARRLKEALTQSGFSVWWQEEIQCGKEWHGEIDDAIEKAGCVIVLWSSLAQESRWVCHEASQAIAREVYAPARLEPIEINSPYNRLQATDLFHWDGNTQHPGFQSLLKRVDELLPRPLSRGERIFRFIGVNRGLLLSILVAAFAMGLLFQQSMNMASQLRRQEELAVQIERSLQPITGLEFTAAIGIDDKIEGVKAFKDKLRAVLIDPATKTLRTDLPKGVKATQEILDETSVIISQESELWPREEADPLLYFTALQITITVTFQKNGVLSEFVHPFGGKYDLQFRIDSLDQDRESGEEAYIAWNPVSSYLEVVFTDTPSTRHWHSNGNIVSVPDLEKSLVKFTIENWVVPDYGKAQALLRNRKLLTINYIRMNYSGRTITFAQDLITDPEEDDRQSAVSFTADMSKKGF